MHIIPVLFLFAAFTASADTHANTHEVQWKRNVADDWRSSTVRTLDDLDDWQPPAQPYARSRYGGWLDERVDDGTGYFRVENIDGRWTFIDPDGYRYYAVGLTSVRPRRGEPAESAYARRWDSERDWAKDTVHYLRELGYNGLGRWSHIEALNRTAARLPYTTSVSFMGSFGGKHNLTTWGYGNARYEHNAIPVFHPGFEAHCDEIAREQILPHARDPYVLGHFTDNELPMPRNLLETTLEIDPAETPALRHNLIAARRFLAERHGPEAGIEAITDEDNLDYLGLVMDRYYRITTAVLRRHAPNHLNLGSRLHGAGIHIDQVIEAAGNHLDVVSMNYYNVWAPAGRHLERWHTHAPDTPFLITEFYVKGEDSGMDNDPGAGWIVPTQHDRGLWYQNFVLRLLEAPNSVGWQYFNYQDRPGDSNKGILDTRFQPHRDFIDLMTPVHQHVYALRAYFDAVQGE